jgi:restriction endonuclease Mrr
VAIPDYQTLMLPLLKLAGDGKVHTERDAVNELAVQFGVSEEERKELLPSGNQEVSDNRVGWARTYLKKAGLIDYVQRGQFQITERGRSVRRIRHVLTFPTYANSRSFSNSTISPPTRRQCKNNFRSLRQWRPLKNLWHRDT